MTSKADPKDIARMTERRLGNKNDTVEGDRLKSSELPADYLKMVSEVFTANFDSGLKALAKMGPEAHFVSRGRIFPNEILVCVSLLHEGQLAATTIYASSDYDPKASSPTIQDLLANCVDAIGALFGELLSSDKPEKLEALADESLSALENVPFQWTSVEMERRKIFLKVDKSNPLLDQMADDWLAKNDPEMKEAEAEEQRETEKLFVTGSSSKKKLH